MSQYLNPNLPLFDVFELISNYPHRHFFPSLFMLSSTLQMFMSEAGKISQKIKVWFSDYFNVSDFVAIVTFFIGFGLRLGGGDAFVPGRTVYCLNIIFWYVRLMDILAVNQQAGPYVMMIAKMVSESA